MKSPHLLKAANNVHRLKENLTNVLDAGGLAAIEAKFWLTLHNSIGSEEVTSCSQFVEIIGLGGKRSRASIMPPTMPPVLSDYA